MAKEKDKYIRIRLSTYRELRSLFPAKRKESFADYMERFVSYIVVNSVERDI